MAKQPKYEPPVGVPSIPVVSTKVNQNKMINHNQLARRSAGNTGRAQSPAPSGETGSTKQADIASALRRIKQWMAEHAGAEFRTVDKAPGSSMVGNKLKPNTLYDPSTIHLLGKNKLQQGLLTGLDYGIPAITAGSIQEATGGMGKQPNESWSDYALRTTGAGATGLATAPVGLATIAKRIPHARMFSGQADKTTSAMKGLLGPLLTKATVGAVGLAPSLYGDLKQFTGNMAGAATNVNKGTEGMDVGKTLKQVGEGVEGVSAGLQGTSNAANQLPDLMREQAAAQLKAQQAQGEGFQKAVKPIGDLATSATGMLNSIKNNWGWAAGGAGAGIGGVILANRLMKMRENLAKEKTKQTMLQRPGSGKKRKLTIDPGDYDFEIKNFQVNPEHQGLY